MKDLQGLDKRLEEIEGQMRYMNEILADTSRPDEAREGVKESLSKLQEEKNRLLEEIRRP